MFVVLLFVPLAFFIIFGGKLFDFSKVKLKGKLIVLLIAVVFQIGTVLAVGIDRDSSDTKSTTIFITVNCNRLPCVNATDFTNAKA